LKLKETHVTIWIRRDISSCCHTWCKRIECISTSRWTRTWI